MNAMRGVSGKTVVFDHHQDSASTKITSNPPAASVTEQPVRSPVLQESGVEDSQPRALRSFDISRDHRALAAPYSIDGAIRDFCNANTSLDSVPNKQTLMDYYQLCSEDERIALWHQLATKAANFHMRIMFSSQKLGMDFTPYQSRVYQRIYTARSTRGELPIASRIPDSAPVNFVWVGGLLPDRYLENIRRTAACIPRKEVVLWMDKTLLTAEQHQQMLRLPELKELQHLNVKVLDINEVDFNKALPDSGKAISELIQFAGKDLNAMSMISDILRYALLVLGSQVIDEAEGRPSERDSSAMIYMDTDRGPDTAEPVEWDEMSAPAGFLVPGSGRTSDVLAAAYQDHPLFIQALQNIVDNFDEQGRRESLEYRQFRAVHLANIVHRCGPTVLTNAFNQISGSEDTLGYYPFMEFTSPATGSLKSDASWVSDCKVDLSASWMNRLS